MPCWTLNQPGSYETDGEKITQLDPEKRLNVIERVKKIAPGQSFCRDQGLQNLNAGAGAMKDGSTNKIDVEKTSCPKDGLLYSGSGVVRRGQPFAGSASPLARRGCAFRRRRLVSGCPSPDYQPRPV